uniref:Uncharacterized protein n=1 Tax=Oryza brachyantha TaxID=4533 RepID=J3MC36_ORYBR
MAFIAHSRQCDQSLFFKAQKNACDPSKVCLAAHMLFDAMPKRDIVWYKAVILIARLISSSALGTRS